MINLISKTPQKVIEKIGLEDYRHYCGMLSTPLTQYDLSAAADLGVPWALDNGCFKQYQPKIIMRELERWQGLEGCLFAVLPDVWQNHDETYLLSMPWIDSFHRLGYPPAFVVQDGCKVEKIPWAEIAAIFIGGSNKFKISPELLEICKEAKNLGLWLHHGRVGGLDRLKRSRDILLCDSIDSTGYSIQPQRIKEDLEHFAIGKQPLLFAV